MVQYIGCGIEPSEEIGGVSVFRVEGVDGAGGCDCSIVHDSAVCFRSWPSHYQSKDERDSEPRREVREGGIEDYRVLRL